MKKRVLITGASSLLGEKIALKFSSCGYDLVLTYNQNGEAVQRLKQKIECNGDSLVDMFKVDLESEEDIEALLKKVKEIDVLINNAAYNNDDEMFNKDSGDFVKTYKINAVAPFLLAKCFRNSLIKNKGAIVNVSSTNGIDTMYQESIDYDASKAALINITKNLAKEFAPDVRVNAIAPGWINTKSTEDMEPKFRAIEENKILLGRFGDCEEIAEAIYFLASGNASYINGTVLRIDGGLM